MTNTTVFKTNSGAFVTYAGVFTTNTDRSVAVTTSLNIINNTCASGGPPFCKKLHMCGDVYKSFDQTFSKGGRRPQPMRVPEIQSQTGLTKKFVSLVNFHEVLIKGRSLYHERIANINCPIF